MTLASLKKKMTMADLDPLGQVIGSAKGGGDDEDGETEISSYSSKTPPEVEALMPALFQNKKRRPKPYDLVVPANPAALVDPAGLYTSYYLAPNIVPRFPLFYWKNLHVINRPANR